MNKISEKNLNLEYNEKILENHTHFLAKHRGVKECVEYENEKLIYSHLFVLF